MSKLNYNFIILALLTMISASAYASEVYIDQIGDDLVANITQTGTGNTVGTSSAAVELKGNSIALDLIQDGMLNSATVILDAATSTVLNYKATGDSNILDVYVNGGTGNSLASVVVGDSNNLTMCATNDGAGVSAACSTGIAVNGTTNIVDIDGSNNTVNLQLQSAGATNTINIGQSLGSSDGNLVNLTQTNADTNIVTLAVEGADNTVNIIQN